MEKKEERQKHYNESTKIVRLGNSGYCNTYHNILNFFEDIDSLFVLLFVCLYFFLFPGSREQNNKYKHLSGAWPEFKCHVLTLLYMYSLSLSLFLKVDSTAKFLIVMKQFTFRNEINLSTVMYVYVTCCALLSVLLPAVVVASYKTGSRFSECMVFS